MASDLRRADFDMVHLHNGWAAKQQFRKTTDGVDGVRWSVRRTSYNDA